MKYVFDFTQVNNKICMIHLLKDVLQISLPKAKDIFEKGKVTLDSTKYSSLDRYLDNFKHADENVIITEFKETMRPYKPFTLGEKENKQNTPLERAKQVVYCHSDCVLLTKEEYQELCKYKGLYLDIIGHIKTAIKEFEENGQSN